MMSISRLTLLLGIGVLIFGAYQVFNQKTYGIDRVGIECSLPEKIVANQKLASPLVIDNQNPFEVRIVGWNMC